MRSILRSAVPSAFVLLSIAACSQASDGISRDDEGPVGHTSEALGNCTPDGACTVETALGNGFICARSQAGAVQCWGANSSGQLGRGTTDPNFPTSFNPVPMPVVGLPPAIQITAGDGFACALLADGHVRCWGQNNWGQLGIACNTSGGNCDDASPFGTNLENHPTINVPGAAGAIAITSSANFTCALLSTKSVVCWGSNSFGQLGRGFSSNQGLAPAIGPYIKGATKISAGGNAVCMLDAQSNASCWGARFWGTTFDPNVLVYGGGTPADQEQLSPVVIAKGPFADVSTGDPYACAIPAIGKGLTCWGWNWAADQFSNMAQGAFGQKDFVTLATSVGVGKNFHCALLSSGRVGCTGNGTSGQIGDDQNPANWPNNSPFLVPKVASALAVWTPSALGTGNACALVAGDKENDLWCWGQDWFGQLGAAVTGQQSATPLVVPISW